MGQNGITVIAVFDFPKIKTCFSNPLQNMHWRASKNAKSCFESPEYEKLN